MLIPWQVEYAVKHEMANPNPNPNPNPHQVEYAVKHEMAVTVKDMLSLRMRLAYINSEAAKQAIPRVAELMAQHLKWSKKEKNRQACP